MERDSCQILVKAARRPLAANLLFGLVFGLHWGPAGMVRSTVCNESIRNARHPQRGITDYLKNGGRVAVAQRVAGHSNAETTVASTTSATMTSASMKSSGSGFENCYSSHSAETNPRSGHDPKLRD